jgi:hypothetical protein
MDSIAFNQNRLTGDDLFFGHGNQIYIFNRNPLLRIRASNGQQDCQYNYPE